MLRWAQKRAKNIKFKTKILFIVGSVALIPTAVLVVYFMVQLSSLQATLQEELDLSFQQQVRSINTSLDKAIAASRLISTSTEATDFFEMQGDMGDCILEYVKNFRPSLIRSQSAGAPELSSICFYTRNEKLFSNLIVKNVKRRSEDVQLFEEIASRIDDQSFLILPTRSIKPDAQQDSLSLFLPILTTTAKRTYVECELSFSSIFHSLSLDTDGFANTGYTLIYQSGEVLFSSDPDWAQQIPELLGDEFWERDIVNKSVKLDGNSYLVNSAFLSRCGCALICHSNAGVILDQVQQNRVLYILLIVTCFVIACLIANTLVDHLLARTDTINAAILQMQQGNFDISLEIPGTDFLDNISENLNEMASRIESLIQNNYKKQLQIKDLEVRMLSQQISPHFLYNTLECLRMYALDNNDIEVSNALASLGKLLRYYADSSFAFSPLRAELKVVEDYISIMNVLEGKNCHFEADLPPELLSCSIPRFVLQPLVENSIKHGLDSNSRELKIRMTGGMKGERLVLSLKDNGIGASREETEKIQSKLKAEAAYEFGVRQSSIGLYNTNARIKLLYGEQYGITFSSIQGKGSLVRIALPLPEQQEAGKKEEDANG